MTILRRILTMAIASAIAATPAFADTPAKGGSDQFGPYEPVKNWFKPLRPGFLDRAGSVFVESPNRIFVTTTLEFNVPAPSAPGAPVAQTTSTGEHFVMVLDADGNVVEDWKQWNHLFKMPHRVAISPYDPERSVWVVDRENDQVFKLSHDGKKLLMTLGEKGVPGTDEKHFGRPADISFLPDGSFYIADGYDNTRVIKFDKAGKFLFAWGSRGKGHGQFDGQVHDVAVDPKGRVFVADRGNNRIQIFDATGKYLDEWDNIEGPSFLWLTKDGDVWVVSGRGNRLLKYSSEGKLLTYWGMFGAGSGQLDDPHDLSVDSAGNLYVSIYSTKKTGVEKFVPRANAEPGRLVRPGFARTL